MFESEEVINIGDVLLANIPSLEECSHIGFAPAEFNVVVAVAGVVEKTKGGILLPETSKDALQSSYQIGRLVKRAPLAFDLSKRPFPEGTQPPQVGEVVLFARWAGHPMKGLDGKDYKLMKDKDIIGTYDL